MGSIEAYQTSTGETLYRARFRKPDHSSTSKRGFKGKREAQRFLAEQETAINKGQFIDEMHSKTRLESLATPWLAGKKGNSEAIFVSTSGVGLAYPCATDLG